ncbi:MAG TPA: hypothetical protein VEP68_12520 [Anaeromyxobacteraceae bacterium]|nr:hypothetical protein [Anaeromyxobacteraceae bacterium]
MNAPSLALLAVALLTALGGAAAILAWRTFRALGRERAALEGRLAEVATRLEAAEQDSAQAALRAEVAESVLLGKGIADEDDLELARRHIEVSLESGYRPERDGDLH